MKMLITKLLVALLLSFAYGAEAQILEREVLGSTGGSSDSERTRIYMYNVGEQVVNTGISGKFYLTQGFEQSDLLKEDSLGEVSFEILTEFIVYPNPGREVVFIKLESTNDIELVVQLTDMSGHELRRIPVTLEEYIPHVMELTTTDLAVGTYFFNFIIAGEEEKHTAKWVKY
jgi:hypothetical protein